jgi:hypothetical protein
LVARPQGYASPDDAALGAYQKYDAEYLGLPPWKELVGAITETDGVFGFSSPQLVDDQFSVKLTVDASKVVGVYHTHGPGGPWNGEQFSPRDAQFMLDTKNQYRFYLRTPSGDVRVLQQFEGRQFRPGRSICPGGSPCMTPR